MAVLTTLLYGISFRFFECKKKEVYTRANGRMGKKRLSLADGTWKLFLQ